MTSIFNKRNSIIFFVLLSLIFPAVVPNDYFLYLMTTAFIWVIAVSGLNILAGYTGYLSLAHAGFFAIGAYSLGLLTVKAEMNYWIAFVLTLGITSLIGLLVGLIALRTKEHFFAIYTLCVGYIIYLVIDKWEGLTGGVRGLIGIPTPANIGPIAFDSVHSQYYLVLFFMLLSLLIIYRIVHSLTGRTFIAIRNSEQLATTIGVSTMKNKLLAFVLSTFFAGMSGALYASVIRFIGPEIAYTSVMFDLLMYLLVGGIGTIAGPVAGAIVIVWVSQQLQFLQEYRMLIFGPLLTLIIIFYPRGIVGAFISLKTRAQAKKRKVPIVNESLTPTKKQIEEG
ncbi:branched-chain amino acid ABC transporter permease [Bacillus sp. JJ634]